MWVSLKADFVRLQRLGGILSKEGFRFTQFRSRVTSLIQHSKHLLSAYCVCSGKQNRQKSLPLWSLYSDRRETRKWNKAYVALEQVVSALVSLVAQTVKNLPAMQETWVWSLGRKDPLEKGMATHSSVPAWKSSTDREMWWATVHGVPKSRTWLSD